MGNLTASLEDYLEVICNHTNTNKTIRAIDISKELNVSRASVTEALKKPSGAIKINENSFIIDLKKCVFCGNCSFYCPKEAIKMSDDYELAVQDKESLELVYKLGGENERNV